MARRIGILGGTFDPIHNGHLRAATDVAIALSLDQVLVIPAGDPWQKSGRVVASAEDRYAMALLATIDEPLLDVSRIEVERHDESYTADTLRALRELYDFATAELFFILGADAFAGLPTWHDYPALLELAEFVVVTRPGHAITHQSSSVDSRVQVVQIQDVDASSTQIRERIALNEGIDDLTPVNVARYIGKRGLYGSVAS